MAADDTNNPLKFPGRDPNEDSRDLPMDADLLSNDLQSAEFVQCPKCQKFCLVDYPRCPRCGSSLKSSNVDRQPLWYVLTVALVLGMIIFYWILQIYSPTHLSVMHPAVPTLPPAQHLATQP